MRDDIFDGNALLTGLLVTVAVALLLVLAPTPVAVPVLVVLAFLCGRIGGRDAGLGSVSAGTLMFGWAISEPHFVWEVQSEGDVVLLLVLFVGALVASEIGARLRLHAASR